MAGVIWSVRHGTTQALHVSNRTETAMTIRLFASIAFALIITDSLFAQEPSPLPGSTAITLSGHSRMTGGSTSPLPSSSSLPQQYLRWELEPTLSLYGVPISAHMLLTTENDASLRSMNSIEVGFDVRAFQDMLRDRIIATVGKPETFVRAKADELKRTLSDSLVAADLRRFDELQHLDTLGMLADSARAELEELRVKTEEARELAGEVERYARMDPIALAREKEKELKALERDLVDPDRLEEKLRELDLLSGAESFLYGFRDLGVGVTYPHYSPLVLTGVPVTGASVEYTYGLFTIAGAGGSMNGPIPDARAASQTFDRGVVAGKIGVGATSGTHLHLMGLYATDDSTTANADSVYTPGKNYVLAADARIELFDAAITIGGQVAGSMLTRDLTASTIDLGPTGDPTGLNLVETVDARISTSVDYAWSAETAFNLFDGATRGKLAVKKVGPGYTSLGVPYLRTDLLGQEGELEQRLLDGQISLGGYYKQNEDNIVPWKRVQVGQEWLPARTKLTSYGGRVGLQFRGLPFLRVEYAPYLQQTDIEGDTTGADNRTAMVTAMAGHGYRLFELIGATNVMALVQEGTSNNGAYRFTNRIYSLNQSVGFASSLSLSGSGTYTETEVANTRMKIMAVSGSGSMKLTDFLRGTLSLTYSDRNDGGSRLGFSVRTTLKLWGYGELDLRAERNAYQSGVAVDEDYEQLRFRGVLTTAW
jgi:hypothetical protein